MFLPGKKETHTLVLRTVGKMALQDTSLGEETKVGQKKRLFKGRDGPRVSSEERKNGST